MLYFPPHAILITPWPTPPSPTPPNDYTRPLSPTQFKHSQRLCISWKKEHPSRTLLLTILLQHRYPFGPPPHLIYTQSRHFLLLTWNTSALKPRPPAVAPKCGHGPRTHARPNHNVTTRIPTVPYASVRINLGPLPIPAQHPDDLHPKWDHPAIPYQCGSSL